MNHLTEIIYSTVLASCLLSLNTNPDEPITTSHMLVPTKLCCCFCGVNTNFLDVFVWNADNRNLLWSLL